jgi:hypothetical protein
MLLSTKHMFGFKIDASDGEIGHLYNFLVDDWTWIVRYAVVDIGNWIAGRRVLIAPSAAENPDGEAKRMSIRLTKEQIENSPEIDTDLPVSRRQEARIYAHFQWEPYWVGGMTPLAPVYNPKYLAAMSEAKESSGEHPGENGDPHLRSIREMTHYGIHARDGEIGHIEDFIVDSEDWVIRYFVVDTRNWLPGKHVIIAPQWIEDISWTESSVSVSMSKEEVEGSPEYDPGLPINMEYQSRLYDYYGRPKYWE